MSKYTIEEKLKIVSLVQNGKSIHSLWCESHIKERTGVLPYLKQLIYFFKCLLWDKYNIKAMQIQNRVTKINLYICQKNINIVLKLIIHQVKEC